MFRKWLFKPLQARLDKMSKDLDDVNSALDTNAQVTTQLISLATAIKLQLEEAIAGGAGISHDDVVAMKDRIVAETQLISETLASLSDTGGGDTTEPVGEAQQVMNSDGTGATNSDGTPLMQVWDATAGAWVTPTLDTSGSPVNVH